MFPPLVRFSWKRRTKNGSLEEPPPAEGERPELRESGRSASIRVLDRDLLYTSRYSCHVQHEGGTVEAQTAAELPAPAASCPPEGDPAGSPPELGLPAEVFQAQCRLKLLCLLYAALMLKSLLSCCGLSLLMLLTEQLHTCRLSNLHVDLS